MLLQLLGSLKSNSHTLKDRKSCLDKLTNKRRNRATSKGRQASQNGRSFRRDSHANSWVFRCHGCSINEKVQHLQGCAALMNAATRKRINHHTREKKPSTAKVLGLRDCHARHQIRLLRRHHATRAATYGRRNRPRTPMASAFWRVRVRPGRARSDAQPGPRNPSPEPCDGARRHSGRAGTHRRVRRQTGARAC